MGTKILEKINYYSREYGDFRYRQGILLISDTIILTGSFIISLSETIGTSYPENHILLSLLIALIISLTTFSVLGNYKTLWSTNVDREIIMILISILISTSICFIVEQ